MNNILRKILLTLFCFQLITSAEAQGKSPLEDVVNAIRANRVQDMSRYFDNFVPITINNNQSNYSHNQAEIVLRDFFDKNPPRDLKVVDNGTPDNSSKFVIANFTSPNGKYVVYVLMRMKNNTYLIKEIRLNKE